MTYTQEQLAKLRLIRTNNIGPVAFFSLLEQFGTAQSALDNLPDLCKARGRKVLISPALSVIETEVENLTKAGGEFIMWGDEAYPYLMKNTPDAPPVLSAFGDISLLSTPQIAVVGSRNASIQGKNFTASLVQAWVGQNISITSGLARGIDTVAHQTALAHAGKTVAVVAGGVGHIYPPENKNLWAEIKEKGCIISESKWGEMPTARHFPRRNRVIAGLSFATVVTEAGRRSGSLITAQYAGEYGREVFAVPGSPADPRAQGPNHLIKQGAGMLTEAEDVTNAMPSNWQTYQPMPSVAYTRETEGSLFEAEQPNNALEEAENRAQSLEEQIIANLSIQPVTLDEISRILSNSEPEITAKMAELELEGRIIRHPGGRVSLDVS